jgi:hypothetical protein
MIKRIPDEIARPMRFGMSAPNFPPCARHLRIRFDANALSTISGMGLSPSVVPLIAFAYDGVTSRTTPAFRSQAICSPLAFLPRAVPGYVRFRTKRFALKIGTLAGAGDLSSALTFPTSSVTTMSRPGSLKVLLLAMTMPGLLFGSAAARDDGRYSASPLKPWFDSLKSGKGPCCSDADGFVVADPDWESWQGRYRVRLDGEWIVVPDDAVITEPNRAGRTMVWPIKGSLGTTIRCFLPGSMT